MRTCIKTASVLTGVLAAALATACSEDPPVAPGPSGNPAATSAPLKSLPLEALGEVPPFIEIAREVPSFGGFWFNEQGQIVVAVTDRADFQRVVAMIPARLGPHRPSNGYAAMVVARPFADLARFRAALRAEVFRLTGVVSLGVKETANRVEVGVTDSAVGPAVRALARTLGIPDDAVAVLNVPAPRLLSHTLRSQHPSAAIEGGWEIGPKTCTLGFAAFRNDGSPVFVTNSHCTSTFMGFDGGAITQPDGGGRVGSEILDPAGRPCGPWSAYQCRNADAALISADRPLQFAKIARPTGYTTADQSGGPLTIDHTNPTFTISGSGSNIFSGEPLNKVGRTTGWSRGNVEDTCTDFNIDWYIIQCSDRVDFAAQGGDSGSPVFSMMADGTVWLRGIVLGWQGGLWSDAIMSNLVQIRTDLGPLRVHLVQAHISGPASVPPNSTVTWTGSAFGGKPPFNFAWYRNGGLVYTSSSYSTSSYTANAGSSKFTLRLDVTDALGYTASDTHPVSIGYTCGPPLGAC